MRLAKPCIQGYVWNFGTLPLRGHRLFDDAVFGKLFRVAMAVGFGEKRCSKHLPLSGRSLVWPTHTNSRRLRETSIAAPPIADAVVWRLIDGIDTETLAFYEVIGNGVGSKK